MFIVGDFDCALILVLGPQGSKDQQGWWWRALQTLLTTDSVNKRDRFAFWHEIACAKLIPHHCYPSDASRFEGELKSARIEDVEFIQFRNAPMRVVREVTHSKKDDGDALFLCLQTSGSVLTEQNGRETKLGNESLLLLDPAVPYRAQFGDCSCTLVMKLPRGDLTARLGATTDLLGLELPRAQAETNLLLTILGAALPRAADLRKGTESLRECILDLACAGLIDLRGKDRRGPTYPRSVTLQKIRQIIDARISDPTLDCATVARLAGVSLRYANSLLSEQGTSLGRYIQSRRLARCHQALADPNQAGRKVSEIAFGWGFNDLTHFGRTFKGRYDQTPSEFRRACSPMPRSRD